MIKCACGREYQSFLTPPIHCECGLKLYYSPTGHPIKETGPKVHAIVRDTRKAAHWEELHCELSPTPEWFEDWTRRIPNADCPCTAHWRQYVKENPPDYDDFFRWGVEAHNYVSENHSGRPTYTLRDAYAMYRPDEYQGDSPLLIMSVGTGPEVADILHVTRKSHERYAEQVGADYLVLGNTTEPWWGFEKFRVKDWAERYERTLFVDADVWIKRDSPSLFDIVPVGSVGILDDLANLRPDVKGYCQHERRIVAYAQKVPIWTHELNYNSGVVLVDRKDADVWARPTSEEFPTQHLSEQTWVEHNCLDKQVFDLDWKFNCQHWWGDFDIKASDCHFVHISGTHVDKLAEIQKWTDL